MRIKKELIMNYEVEGTKLVFEDQRTLVLAMGATSIAGNLTIYGIEKKKGKYYVEIDTIRERRRKKMERIRKEQEYLDTMNQILDTLDKENTHKKNKQK